MNETNNASDDEANAFALVFIYFTEQVKWLDTTDYLIVNYHDEKCRFPLFNREVEHFDVRNHLDSNRIENFNLRASIFVMQWKFTRKTHVSFERHSCWINFCVPLFHDLTKQSFL